MRLLTSQERLREVAQRLRTAPRNSGGLAFQGEGLVVHDEPEGTFTVNISHTMANDWAALFDKIAEELDA